MKRPSLATIALSLTVAVVVSGCTQLADGIGTETSISRLIGSTPTKVMAEDAPPEKSTVEFVEMPIGDAPTTEELEEIYAAIEELTARMQEAKSDADGADQGGTGGSGPGNSFTFGEITELTEGSADDFCAALNSARAAQDRPAFETCSRSGSLADHARAMAEKQEIWHSGSDNIVGVSGSFPSLVRAFMDSPSHRALILEDKPHATVGCYWATQTVTRADGSQINPTTLVYCAGAFSQ